jgi:hypothetical protein
MLCCAGCHPSAEARFPEKLKAIEYFESNRSDLDTIADRILDDESISGVTCYFDGQAVLRSNNGGPDLQVDEVQKREFSELCTRAQIGLVWETGAGVYVDGGFVLEGEARFNAGLFRRLHLDSVQDDCAETAELVKLEGADSIW